jgi:acetylglutamate kinase
VVTPGAPGRRLSHGSTATDGHATATGALAEGRDTARLGAAPPVVVKIGGRALGETSGGPGARDLATRALAGELSSLAGALVLVHGGGAEVSAWCERAHLAPRFHDGLRVTDEATLDVAAAVLAGLANKRLVAALRAAGLDAVGLAALDGGIAEVAPHPEADALGAVGVVTEVRPDLIEALLAAGRTPVLASIGAADGMLLNLNADDLAAAVAGALSARALVLLSDAPGLKLAGAVVPRLGAASLEAALAHPEVKDGMRPKLRAARTAIAAGVGRVHIASWEGPGSLAALLDGSGAGTTIIAGSVARGSDD